MREMLYKNLTSIEKRKKEFWICESLENEKVIARTQRHCIYKVKNQTRIEDIQDLNKWIQERSTNNPPSYIKRFVVFKKSDSRTGEELFICKVIGNLYAIINGLVFSIAFMHIIKITLINLSNAKYK